MAITTVAEDSMVADDSRHAGFVFEELPQVLAEHPTSLLCDFWNPLPGVPCFEPEYDYANAQYCSPWGAVERLTGSKLGTRHLWRFHFYRLRRPNPEAPRPQMPQPGYAVIDPITEIVTVYAENGDDDPTSIFNCRVSIDGKDGHKVLKQIRVELAKAGVPVYPSALYAQPSLPYPWEEGRTFEVPRVFNDEVAVSLVGCVLDPDTQGVVYLHIVGSKTACRSIWGTLNTGGTRTLNVILGDQHRTAYSYSQDFDTYSASLDPDINLYHFIVTDHRATARKVEKRAYLVIPNHEGQLDLGRAFAARLNALLPIPVLPQWGGILLDHGLDNDLLNPCAFGGDVAQAYAIGREGWIETIEQLVQGGELTIE